MSRSWLFVPLLLLAAGVALADPAPGDERTAGATEAKARAEESAPAVVPADDAPEVERGAGAAEEKEQTEASKEAPKAEGPKEISGMSILGNQEAPKSLVIVPWKSSEIGDPLGISTMLDDSRRPVDREVFLRELSYYEIQHEGRVGTPDVDEDAGRK